MATVKASEVGIERLHHAKESMGKSWEVVAEESRVAKATIFKLLKGDPVTREVVGDLTTYFKLERREIVTEMERFRAIKAADKPQLVREGMRSIK
jgi:hypothetical protein